MAWHIYRKNLSFGPALAKQTSLSATPSLSIQHFFILSVELDLHNDIEKKAKDKEVTVH